MELKVSLKLMVISLINSRSMGYQNDFEEELFICRLRFNKAESGISSLLFDKQNKALHQLGNG